MQPLEQYPNQTKFFSPLWGKLSGPIRSQFEYDLWLELYDKLYTELWKETLVYILYEELEHQCR